MGCLTDEGGRARPRRLRQRVRGHPRAIYGNDVVTGRDIDLATVRLEAMRVQRVLSRHAALIADFNGDGYEDLSVLIDEKRGAISPGTTQATLTGMLIDGTAFAGTDDICLLPRAHGTQ